MNKLDADKFMATIAHGFTEMPDLVNKPNHYFGLNGLEAREVQEQFVPKYAKYGGMVASDMKDVFKYTMRAPDKNEVEDLKKARKFLDWAIEGMERAK